MSVATPSGVITITTDFGHQGPFVGVMKGRILTRFPAARIIDLTHEIVVHWPAEAGFWLARAFSYFPPGTVHVAVVDPGVGTSRDIIVALADGHFFVAPDNGLLAPVASRSRDVGLVRLTPAGLARLGITHASATFPRPRHLRAHRSRARRGPLCARRSRRDRRVAGAVVG